MIKFFRRIRQRLLLENKIGKYLFYAVGEVVLVVIGILIALSINNWNENRKNAALESYYLNSLKSNIIQDTTNYGIRLRDINRTLTELDSAAIKLNLDSNEELWTDKVPRIFMSTFNVNSETSVIEDLKSTGNLSLISNKKIIDSVLVYYKGIDETKVGINNSLQTYARETIGPYLMMKYEVTFNGQTEFSSQKTNKSILTTTALREDLFLTNALGYRKSIITGLRFNYLVTINRASQILDLLNSEIDQ